MEKQIVVNEKDEIIGYKERGTLAPEDIYRVSALWIENSKGEILLARRAHTKKKDPGKWGPAVAGTVEEGETYESNIIKEAEEELGLINISPQQGLKKRIKNPHNYIVKLFLLKLDKEIEEFKINKKEVAEIKWFTKQEILTLIGNKSPELINSLRHIANEFLR